MGGTARKQGRPWWRIYRRMLRDATVCQIPECGRPIDKSLRWPHPMSFSIDHIVPLSQGGSEFDRHNLRPAHLLCNQRRGDGTAARRKARSNPTSRSW